MAFYTVMDGFYSQTVLVQSRPNAVDGLSTILLVSGDSTLDGDRYRTYASLAEVQTDVDAGDVSATALAMATTAFGQSPRPALVAIGRQTDPESFSAALTAISAAGLLFSMFAIDSHVAADVTSAASFAETGYFLFVAVCNDAAAITGSPPSGWPTTSKNTAKIYHPTAGQYPDVAAIALAAGLDPDVQCPAFSAPGSSVTAYSLTTAQRNFAVANGFNALAPLDTGEATYPDGPLKATTGEFAYIAFTKAWLTIRDRQAIAAAYAGYASFNQKFPYNAAGIAAITGALNDVTQTGLAAGYFAPTEALPLGFTTQVTLGGGAATVVRRIGILDAVETISDTVYLERAA